MKLKWKVQPAPTGRYRGFEKRGWPQAEYDNDRCAAMLYCDKAYYPCDAKSSNHPELTIRIADYSVSPWQWRTLKQRAKTLNEAKELVAKFLDQNPAFVPKGE